MGLPPVNTLFELMENQLSANFHISFNTPHLFLQVHAKTAGLKSFLDKSKEKVGSLGGG